MDLRDRLTSRLASVALVSVSLLTAHHQETWGQTDSPKFDRQTADSVLLPVERHEANLTNASYDCGAQTDILAIECQALVALYNSTDGDNWQPIGGWLTGSPCSWTGVTCDTTANTVDSLELAWRGLTGPIPSEVANLTDLAKLDLSYNQLGGSIPSWLGNLSNLTVLSLLASSQFTGPIPSSLGNLTDLKKLVLGGNLGGSIPSSLGNLTNLTELTLLYGLTGSIPSELGNLSNLKRLDLLNNELTGSIPSSLGNLTNLEMLSLAFNNLTGSIPTTLGNLSNLDTLRLDYNQLTGSIPAELGNLSSLTHLYLYNNQLAGSIPTELGNLSNLIELRLASNQLSGSLPASLGSLANLAWLSIGSEQLTGSIPASFGNLTNLTYLGLGGSLTDSMPPELGNLTNLTHLVLTNNDLTGSIPSTFGNLSNLSDLWLTGNQLTGPIPPELGNLTNLTGLWLDRNDLAGIVPLTVAALGVDLSSCRFENNEPSLCIPDQPEYRALTPDTTICGLLFDPNCGPTGEIAGAIVDAATTDSIPGAMVVVEHGIGSDTTVTDSLGKYSFLSVRAGGGVTVRASKPGYSDNSVTGVNVQDGTLTPGVDIALTPNRGTTVIAHGLAFLRLASNIDKGLDEQQHWSITMAEAIVNRVGAGQICTVVDGNIGGVNPNGGPGDPAACGPTSGETVIVFDWIEESTKGVFGYAEGAADALSALLVQGAVDNRWSLDRLHLIGHSRGTVVLSEVAQRLGMYSDLSLVEDTDLPIDTTIHVTYLDPHPWDNSTSDEIGELLGNARDHDVNAPRGGNRGVKCWANIAYSENFWQNSTLPLELNGWPAPVDCDNNFYLGHMGHSNVHGFYHGTIDYDAVNDSAGLVIDPLWYEGSYGRTTRGFNVAETADGNTASVVETGNESWQSDSSLSPTGLLNGSFDMVSPEDVAEECWPHLPWWLSSICAAGAMPGWEFQGGSVSVFGAEQTIIHNWSLVPTTAASLFFEYRVQIPSINGGLLKVSLFKLNSNNTRTEYLLGTVSLADRSWWSSGMSVPIPFEHRGTVRAVKFELDSKAAKEASVAIDRVGFQTEEDRISAALHQLEQSASKALFALASPHLHAYDGDDNHTGVISDTTYEEAIPGSRLIQQFDSTGSLVAEVIQIASGSATAPYRFEIDANGSAGNYSLSLGQTGASTMVTSFDTVALGSSSMAKVTLSTLSAAVELLIDADGDDSYETSQPSSSATGGMILDARVFLEGGMSGDTMSTRLAALGLVPTSQPFSGAPWNYPGSENVTTVPPDVVDWVLLEIRADSSGASAIDTVAALLRFDGLVVSTDGSGVLTFPSLAAGNYHVVISHRNHLRAMTSSKLAFSPTSTLADLTSGAGQAFGSNAVKSLSGGSTALFACDINLDGQTTAADFNEWLAKTKAVVTGYDQADCNLDGQVTAADFNLWLTNTKAVAASKVPE